MVLGQRVAVHHRRVFNPVQQHVHAANPQHGAVKIKPVKHAVVEVFLQLGVLKDLAVVLPQVLPRRHQKATGATRRVTDHILRCRLGQLHHQLNDVSRRAKLPILPRTGNLPQHVLIEIALGVAIVHWHMVEQVHHLRQQRRSRYRKASILHMLGVGRAIPIAAQKLRPQKRKHMLAHHLIHFPRFHVLKARPAQILVGPLLRINAFWEYLPLHRLLHRISLVLLAGVQLIEPPQKQQVGNLLNHF